MSERIVYVVVGTGGGWEQPIVYGVYSTAMKADAARKEANEVHNRRKATMGAFRIERRICEFK